MGMTRELRKRLLKAEGRLRREGRRLASVLLCGALVVGNLSAVPVSALADSDSDNEYTYEIEKTALQAALQTAVSEGNTVNEDLEFAGEHAEEYAELLEADGTLYELELADDEIDEDDDRDKALDLRIFARIEGDIPLDEAYEIDGSEEIVFLLSNKTDETVTATICVDELETEAITILPAASIPVDEESTAVGTAEAVTTAISSGVSAGGAGGGGSSGSSAAATEVTDGTEEAPEIEIMDAADEAEAESITEDSDVSVLSGEDDSASGMAADGKDADASDAAEGNISADPEEAGDPAVDVEDENAGMDNNTEDANADENAENSGAADADSKDSGEAEDSTGDTADEDVNSDSGSADSADSASGTADADDTGASGNEGSDSSNDAAGNEDNDNENDTSDDNSGSDITEDSEVSVLGSAISIHNSVLLAASKATASDADETASPSDASPSDADKIIDGELYEAVRFDKYGAVAFATTSADLGLDQIIYVDYTAEKDGVAVTVSAPAGALPDGAELSVTLYEEDSYEYLAAAEAIDYKADETTEETAEETESEISLTSEEDSEESDTEETTGSSGLAVMDISFIVDGEEVEPTGAVAVTIDASGILPEDADADSIEVQHLTESEDGLEATLVADAGDASEGTVDTDAVVAEFTVDSFSTFTLTWNGGNSLTIICIDDNGTEISGSDSTLDISTATAVAILAPGFNGYKFERAVAVTSGSSSSDAANSSNEVTYLRREGGQWQFSSDGSYYTNVTSRYGQWGETSYTIYFIYTADTGSIVLNLGNGNGILQDSDYSGGSQGSNGTDLRYTVNVADAADENENVTINLPCDGDLDNSSFVVATGTSGVITQALDNEAAPYAWKLVGWVNIATGDYYDVSGGSVTATVDLNKNNVFYADWVAESYDFGSSSNLGEDTSSFVKINMFDYNELFNLYSASLTQSGLTSESWADSGNLYSEILQSGSILDKSFIFQNCKTSNNNDSYSSSNGLLGFVTDLHSTSPYWNWNNETTYNVWKMDNASDSPIFNKLFDTSDSTIGVKYVGSANYLFQIDDDKYYYFNSDKNGASYNQSAQRFYLSENTTTVTGNGWNGYNAFFPYNEVGNYTSISDGTLNNWFGMNVEMDFYLPNDVGDGGNQYNNEDMVFEFSGDDDVWVYVDDALVLNLSGIHSAMSGSINFSTGEVNANGTTTELSCGAGTHTMSIYYMERGAWDSNLSIKFNTVPRWEYETASAGTMSVTKEWSDSETAHDAVTMGLFVKTNTKANAGETVSYDGKEYILDSSGYSYDSTTGYVNAYVSGDYLYVLVDTKEVNKDNSWTYTWELLDINETYEVKELTTLSNYKTTSDYDTLQEYEYWSATGYEELNGTVTYSNNIYSRSGGILHDGLEIVLTDGAQNGEDTATSTFPTTYTGYVIYDNDGSIETRVAQFSQAATLDDEEDDTYTYGVTTDSEVEGAVWYVKMTGDYATFTVEGSPTTYAPTFYLRNSAGNCLTITGSSGNYSLTTSSTGTPFSYNNLGELNTEDSTGVKVTVTDDGNYALVTGRQTETNPLNVKIYVKQEVTTTGKSYTITNTLLPTITLKKVDSADETKTLSNAEFTLTNSDDKYYSYIGNTVKWDDNSTMTTDSKGEIAFTALPDGEYTLTEVSAPDGYNLLSGTITIEVADGVISYASYSGAEGNTVSIDSTKLILTVTNTAGSELPETGGPGTMPFRLAGLLLTSCSAYLLYQTLRRRRNCLEL